MKYKDLSHFNLGLLPADAAAYRGWKNSLLTQMQRYDCSADNHLISWITLALTARGKAAKSLRADSGLLPRLDKLIAAEIMVAKTLTSAGDLALEMQAYVEECSLEGAPPRGRYMLNMISRSFDMDRRRGSMLTEMQILSHRSARLFDSQLANVSLEGTVRHWRSPSRGPTLGLTARTMAVPAPEGLQETGEEHRSLQSECSL